jgi:ribosomal protein S27E
VGVGAPARAPNRTHAGELRLRKKSRGRKHRRFDSKGICSSRVLTTVQTEHVNKPHTNSLSKEFASRSMARNGLRTRPPGLDPRAADGDGRRIPFASIPHHTLILLGRASAPYSLPRPRNGNFAHASRSDGPCNLLELQALHPAQPSALVLYCSDFTLTLLHTGRSLDHRNPTGAQRASSARSGFLIVCCSDCTSTSFPFASASFTHSHTLSLHSCCRPTAGKSSSPAGLSTLVYAHVVDCAPASPYAYSSSTHTQVSR